MRVLVTGATGYTGSYVVPLLLRHNHDVICFVRPGSVTDVLPIQQVKLRIGDLSDSASLLQALEGVDALVNVASLGFGHGPGIVSAAEQAEIGRAVFVSTTAVDTSLAAPSKRVRLAAEDSIRQSKLAFTILRPTMIYGTDRDRNISRLLRFLHRWPVVPVFGDGRHLQQPVHVEDVAAAIIQSLESQSAIGKTYNISGAAPVTYNELIQTACGLMNRKVWRLHLPLAPVVKVLRLLERLGLRLPLRAEQIERLNEDKAFDHSAATHDFSYQPRSVATGLHQELATMGLLSTAVSPPMEAINK